MTGGPDDLGSGVWCYVAKAHCSGVTRRVLDGRMRLACPIGLQVVFHRHISRIVVIAIEQNLCKIGAIGHAVPVFALGRSADPDAHGAQRSVDRQGLRIDFNGVGHRIARVTLNVEPYRRRRYLSQNRRRNSRQKYCAGNNQGVCRGEYVEVFQKDFLRSGTIVTSTFARRKLPAPASSSVPGTRYRTG